MQINDILYRFKKSIFISILLIIVIKTLFLMPTIILGNIVDKINVKNYDVEFDVIKIVFLVFIYSLISPFSAKYVSNTIQKIIYKISIKLTDEIFKKDFDFFKNSNIGSIIRQTERGIISYEKILTYVFNVVIPSLIIFFIIGFYIFFKLGFSLYLYCLLFSFFSFFIILKTIAIRRKYINNLNDSEDHLSDCFAETFMSAKTIKYNNIFEKSSSLLKKSYKSYGFNSSNLLFYTEFLNVIHVVIINLLSISIIIFGIYFFKNNLYNFTLGNFVVLLSLSGIMISNVISLTESYKEYDQFKIDKKRIDGLYSLPKFKKHDLTDNIFSEYKLLIHPFERKISPQKSIVNNSLIEVNFGSKVAIVGETGEGKSTLLNIISGLDKSNGIVTVDNIDTDNMTMRDISNIFSFSFQFPEFLTGNIKRSIFFDIDVDSKYFNKFKKIASSIGINFFEKSILDDNFNFKNLSGGEIKRIDLLRTFFKGSPIIILDEPTSSLDMDISSSIWDIIFSNNQNSTIICATHDLSKIDEFDMIIYINDGVIDITKKGNC
ncbi:ATP-binding cassette domain-containing protein [Acinetobacter venetianus]|uniref:ATP-binding cassette domain-containing protein n=1 Tax=Acinetobacter venetianus TaxID=52133 RepID=UPI003850C517